MWVENIPGVLIFLSILHPTPHSFLFLNLTSFPASVGDSPLRPQFRSYTGNFEVLHIIALCCQVEDTGNSLSLNLLSKMWSLRILQREWLKASLGKRCQEFLFILTYATCMLFSVALLANTLKGTNHCWPSRAQKPRAKISQSRVQRVNCYSLGTLVWTLVIWGPGSWVHSRWPRARVQAESHWSQLSP